MYIITFRYMFFEDDNNDKLVNNVSLVLKVLEIQDGHQFSQKSFIV